MRPNPNNPRKISDKKLSMLKKSLNEFGDLSGIILNKTTGFLVSGHQRIKLIGDIKPNITKKYPSPTPQGTTAEGYIEYEGERFTYREVKWGPEKETAAMIAANNQGGENDFAILSDMITHLDSINLDLDLIGLDEKEIENIMTYSPKEHPNSEIEDNIPETKENELGVKTGDLWILGNHRLLCGDATSKEDVERLMDGQKADMVYTDPPYGIAYKSSHKKEANTDRSGNTRKGNEFGILVGDEQRFDPSSLLMFFTDVNEVFIWGACNFCDSLPISTWICWDRKSGNLDKNQSGDFDLCWSKQKHKMAMARITWSGAYGHNRVTDGAKKVHPTQKPVKLAEWFFERWGKDKTNIVDLYLGSGSTLIACEKTQRRCFGMEIDPHYCSVIIKRWETFTGKKAHKFHVKRRNADSQQRENTVTIN